MANFNELMQDFVNKDYEELVGIGKIAFTNVYPMCKAVADDNEKGFFLMTSILLAAVGADGTLTALERKWFHDVMDLNDQQIDDLIKMFDPQMFDLVDQFHDALPTEAKSHIMMLTLSIMAVDEKISKEETAFIKKLFA